MTQRQLLRQLAEAGRLRLQDFDDAALAHLVLLLASAIANRRAAHR